MNNIHSIVQRMDTLAEDYNFYRSVGDFMLAEQVKADWTYFKKQALKLAKGAAHVL